VGSNGRGASRAKRAEAEVTSETELSGEGRSVPAGRREKARQGNASRCGLVGQDCPQALGVGWPCVNGGGVAVVGELSCAGWAEGVPVTNARVGQKGNSNERIEPDRKEGAKGRIVGGTKLPQIIQDQKWWDERRSDGRWCVLKAEEGRLSGVQSFVEERARKRQPQKLRQARRERGRARARE
jgi:hypothetical protein